MTSYSNGEEYSLRLLVAFEIRHGHPIMWRRNRPELCVKSEFAWSVVRAGRCAVLGLSVLVLWLEISHWSSFAGMA